MNRPDRLRTSHEQGSPEYFQQFWADDTAQRSAYPGPVPATQWDLFEREKARLLEQLLAQHGRPLRASLEYGCGSAGISAYLANQGFTAVATDLDPGALDVARANWRAHRTPAAPGVFVTALADAFHLPFPDSAFDLVMSYGLLEHFDNPSLQRSFVEARRVLKPGGIIAGDIAHGRFSVRTVATWLNFAASAVYHTLRGQFRKLPSLRAAYFEPFYENDLGLVDWAECLKAFGFIQVQVLCIRPFPPLALAGRLEKVYIRLMERALPFYRWFDQSQSALSRRWGWTYLFCAVKPGTSASTVNAAPLAPRRQ